MLALSLDEVLGPTGAYDPISILELVRSSLWGNREDANSFSIHLLQSFEAVVSDPNHSAWDD